MLHEIPGQKNIRLCEGLEVFKYLPTIPLFVSLSSPKPGLPPWQDCPAAKLGTLLRNFAIDTWDGCVVT